MDSAGSITMPHTLFEDSRANAVLATLDDSPDLARRVEDGRRAAYASESADAFAIDAYDAYYRHVILVDAAGRSIGGMRLGVGAEITTQRGPDAFYTARYWEFHPPMVDLASKGLDLGRVWVHPDFQRQVWSMALLWKALAVFHDAVPYDCLLGTVSLVDYPAASARMILEYLRHYHPSPEELVTARSPAETGDPAAYARTHADITQRSALRALVDRLREISPEHPMPVLLRHYIRMGATIPGCAMSPERPSKVMIMVLMQSDAITRHKERFKSL